MLNLAIAKYMPREGLLAALTVCPVLGWVWVWVGVFVSLYMGMMCELVGSSSLLMKG